MISHYFVGRKIKLCIKTILTMGFSIEIEEKRKLCIFILLFSGKIKIK